MGMEGGEMWDEHERGRILGVGFWGEDVGDVLRCVVGMCGL